MSGSLSRRYVLAAMLIAATATAVAQTPAQPATKQAPAQKKKSSAPDNYDEIFERYLAEARANAAPNPRQSWDWMGSLSLDQRARRVNDLITIKVVENITGSGTADAAVTKASDASAGIPKLLGIESKLAGVVDTSALVSSKSATDFKGTGSTNRAGILTAQLTARVSNVLPNGDLVVEGVREIEINGDRQMVVLTGVVRVSDISPANAVLSTSMGQLRIRYFGRGLMQDNLKPGFLVRILNKIF